MIYFRALASGSSGNSFLLRSGKVNLLFDAGLRLPSLRRHLAAEGLAVSDISAVLLSHEHRDHCAAAPDMIAMAGVPVWGNPGLLRAAGLADHECCSVLDVGRPTLFGDVEVTTFPVEHDAAAPVGFAIKVEGRSITIATDLGVVTPDVACAIGCADLIVLESNHDPEMLHNGRYPPHLRKRVSGPRGHLSNFQAGAGLAATARDDAEVWLAHLSKENNTTRLALQTVRRILKAAGRARVQVDVALRDRPSLRWHGMIRPRQLSLFDDVLAG